jgi:hypothetical protein
MTAQARAVVPSTYQRVSGLVLGFHGCDKAIGEKILSGKVRHLEISKNAYDWLGDGIYFWENDPQRAREFAEDAVRNTHKSKGKIRKPFVIGAVIDLGLCLNCLDRSALVELKLAHDFLQDIYQTGAPGRPLPTNRGEDRGARFLDAAVIGALHQLRSEVQPGGVPLPAYDSVRGAFWEGDPVYPGAGFAAKNHIQIAVRNPDQCIKGYFRPRP